MLRVVATSHQQYQADRADRARVAVFNPASHQRLFLWSLFALAMLISTVLVAFPSYAQSTAFKLAVAQAASKDKAIAAFYKARNYKPIWTSGADRQRRRALLEALRRAPNHGLPTGRYDASQVNKDFSGFKSAKARGVLEVETTRKFLQYARDIQSGVLEPKRIDENMTLRPPRRDRLKTLQSFAKSSPVAFFKSLPPTDPGYNRLLKEKVRIERIIGRGGWGATVNAKKLKPGQSGKQVVIMRKRLTALGYKRIGTSPKYDTGLERAVQIFQQDSGLNADGVAGSKTIAAMNTSPETRLMQVVIGLERLRWLNKPLGKRHILVNEAAFMAYVIDNGKPTMTTRVVVGKAGRWRTPEFEKKMTHMVINPSWYVPASIAGTEYLPRLQQSSDALTRQDLVMTDTDGNVVNPVGIDFKQYTKDDFPFSLRQPPSGGNALGKVKFMFPNKHAIYLHDTPSRSLFGKDIRTFSHGCVRVQKPDELAYTLLGKQMANPKSFFDGLIATGEEATVKLKEPVPIYLVYRTAWVSADGRPNYRADSYNVDRKVFNALAKAGVVLRGVQS